MNEKYTLPFDMSGCLITCNNCKTVDYVVKRTSVAMIQAKGNIKDGIFRWSVPKYNRCGCSKDLTTEYYESIGQD